MPSRLLKGYAQRIYIDFLLMLIELGGLDVCYNVYNDLHKIEDFFVVR